MEWLRTLVGDWQLVSDLCFADLVLWVRDRSGGWSAVAHARPSTWATVYYDDVVGTVARPGLVRRLDAVVAGVPEPVAVRRRRRASRWTTGTSSGRPRPVPDPAPRCRRPDRGVRRGRQQHRPQLHPHARPAGAGVPGERLAPAGHARRGQLPLRVHAHRAPSRRPAGRGRPAADGRRRRGDLRLAERGLGVPAGGCGDRQRPFAGRGGHREHAGAGPGRRGPAPGGDGPCAVALRPGDAWLGAVAARRARSCAGRVRCPSGSVRWCWCAT